MSSAGLEGRAWRRRAMPDRPTGRGLVGADCAG